MYKSYDPQGDVETFMTVCGQKVGIYSQLPSREVLLLRARLIYEEACEFVEAAGCVIINKGDKYEVLIEPAIKPDIVEMADACGDLNYVTYGAASTLGIRMIPVHDEVQSSNMTKIGEDGKVQRRTDGKVIKPETFREPDIESVLRAQGWSEDADC